MLMPNQPKTPVHSIRVSDKLWGALKAKAVREDRSVSDVVIEAIENLLEAEK